MAFCYKCGNQLPDGVAFCPKCGAAQSNSTPKPQNKVNTTRAPGDYKQLPFALPDLRSIVAIGLAILTFVLFLVLPVFACSDDGDSVSACILSSEFNYEGYEVSFDLLEQFGGPNYNGVLFVFARIFAVLAIIAFVAYIITALININSFIPSFKISFKKLTSIIFPGCIGVSMLFVLIGILATESTAITVGWFFVVALAALFAVYELTHFIRQFIPNIKF